MQSTSIEPGPETLNPVSVNSLDFDFTSSNTNVNVKSVNTSTNTFDFSAPSGTDADLEALLKLRDMSLDSKATPVNDAPVNDAPVNETPAKKSKKKLDPQHGEYHAPRPSRVYIDQ